MSPLWIPFLLQAALMGLDELYFHRKRGLHSWEIWSHPVDSFSTLGCIAFLLFAAPTSANAWTFALLAAGSALLCTKDEFVHLEQCERAEQWVHSVLFLLHPTMFFCSGLLWWNHEPPYFFVAQISLIAIVFVFQVSFWGIPWLMARSTTRSTTSTATAGTPPTTIL